MEVAVLQQLSKCALYPHIHKVDDVEAGSIHSGFVRELDAVYELHGEHFAGGQLPLDLGDAYAGHVAVKLLDMHSLNLTSLRQLQTGKMEDAMMLHRVIGISMTERLAAGQPTMEQEKYLF